MNKLRLTLLFAVLGQLSFSIHTAVAEDHRIDPRADELLRSASKRIADAKSFSVKTEVWQDRVLGGEWKAQSSKTVDVSMRRPDRLRADTRSSARNTDLYYDGKTITLFNRDKNLYGTIKAPDTLDKTIDFAIDRFGITMPLADLIFSDPYSNAVQNVVRGKYLGTSVVEGRRCHQLAFIQDNVDWQAWIQEGSEPLIRKIVITYKQEPQSPQFTALFNDWKFDETLSDSTFAFNPPSGASKINVAELKPQPPETATPENPVNEPAGAKTSETNQSAVGNSPKGKE